MLQSIPVDAQQVLKLLISINASSPRTQSCVPGTCHFQCNLLVYILPLWESEKRLPPNRQTQAQTRLLGAEGTQPSAVSLAPVYSTLLRLIQGLMLALSLSHIQLSLFRFSRGSVSPGNMISEMLSSPVLWSNALWQSHWAPRPFQREREVHHQD